MQAFYQTEIERDDREFLIVCQFDCTPASRGARGKYGEPLEPDSPAEVALVEAWEQPGGKQIELTEAEVEKITDAFISECE